MKLWEVMLKWIKNFEVDNILDTIPGVEFILDLIRVSKF